MKKLSYIFLSVAIWAFSSCELAETNVDPTQLQDVSLRLVLPSLMAHTAFNQSANPARVTGIIMQQFEGFDAQQVQYTQYQIDETTFNNFWNFGAYAGALKDGSVILQKAEEEGEPYYSGIAKILMAESYGLLTTFFGDIPFSDALKGTESLKPVYDTQEQVINGIQSMLDQAIADLSQAPTAGAPGSDDLIYGGDADAWIRVAHALKARYFIQSSRKNGGAAASALAEVNQAFTSVADAPYFQFEESQVTNNPLAKFGVERPNTLIIAQSFVDALNARQDPRKPFYVDESGTSPLYFNSANPNLVWAQNNSAIPIISYAELMFIRAEALVRTNASDADVEAALREAVIASMEQVGLNDPADYQAYVDANANLGGATTPDGKIARIIEEAYYAYYGYAFQQIWNNFRRTGVPALTPNPNGLNGLNPSGGVPVRYLYPMDETNTNSANLNAAIDRQGGALLDDPIWLFQ